MASTKKKAKEFCTDPKSEEGQLATGASGHDEVEGGVSSSDGPQSEEGQFTSGASGQDEVQGEGVSSSVVSL